MTHTVAHLMEVWFHCQAMDCESRWCITPDEIKVDEGGLAYFIVDRCRNCDGQHRVQVEM